ncbi:MAG TPA: transposase [Thermoanaerobaculia bacterium]|nr:transposase [Thermoanaerobaculia bacterium]
MNSTLALKGFYRRNLPHFVTSLRPLFLTFNTYDRWILPPGARTIALRHALHDHGRKIFMDVAVVMPDHVHLIFTLLQGEFELPCSLAEVMKGIKGVSARRINQLLKRRVPVWQDENFDHVVRDGERSLAKFEYVCNNPVRAGLVRCADEYPWLWRSWVEGRRGAGMQ